MKPDDRARPVEARRESARHRQVGREPADLSGDQRGASRERRGAVRAGRVSRGAGDVTAAARRVPQGLRVVSALRRCSLRARAGLSESSVETNGIATAVRAVRAEQDSGPTAGRPAAPRGRALNLGSVAHIRRGADLERAGKIDEAIAEQQEALRVDPGAVQAHINLIALYGRLGRYEEAAEHYRAALALDRTRPIFTTTTACSSSSRADSGGREGVSRAVRDQSVLCRRARQSRIDVRAAGPAERRVRALFEQRSRTGPTIGPRISTWAASWPTSGNMTKPSSTSSKTLTPEDENTPRYLYALAATYARAGNSGERPEVHPHRPGAGSGPRPGPVAGQHRQGLRSSGEAATTIDNVHAHCLALSLLPRLSSRPRRPLRSSATIAVRRRA